MSTNEPPPRKRKVEAITPTEATSSADGRTLYVLEDGKFVPLSNGGRRGYVSPPPCDSDDDVDPVLEAEYYRQLRESGGFDLDLHIRIGSMLPFKCKDGDHDEIPICAKLALHWFNFHKGSNCQLLRVERYNSIITGICTYYITAHAIDPSRDSRFVFQSIVRRCPCEYDVDFRIAVETCRIKPETQGPRDDRPHWNDEAVDDFYKGELKWLPDDALLQTSDTQQQYYELQESDIKENDWLNLYAEYAFYPLWENRMTKLKFGVPLEIKKVVVQTCEAMEAKEKLKAGNAVFYISFSDCGQKEDNKAVVRRTTDGLPGHVIFEVKCPVVAV